MPIPLPAIGFLRRGGLGVVLRTLRFHLAGLRFTRDRRCGGVRGGVCLRAAHPLGHPRAQETRRNQGIGLRVRVGVEG